MTEQLSLAPRHPVYRLNPPLSEIKIAPILALDVETGGLHAWKDRLRLIAIKSFNTIFLLQPEYYSKQELIGFFAEVGKSLVVCHGTKFDSGFIYCHFGIHFQNLWCTQLGSQILGGGSRKFRHTLDQVLARELKINIGDREEKKAGQKSFLSKADLTEAQLAYAATDVDHLLPLKDALERKLAEKQLDKVVLLENKLTPILVQMEAEGCLIDVAAWRTQLKEWEIKRKEIIAALDAEVMRLWPYTLFTNINYGSSKQVIQFFKNLGLEAPIKEERKGRGEVIERESVDEDTLNNYINENQDSPIIQFVSLLKDYREYEKLLSTYGDSFLERLDTKNHIHTTYSQCTTTTGRLSSKDPNLQNIPSKKSGAGVVIRKFFVAPPGFKMLTSDMKGAEITIAADQSKDPLLLKNVLEDADIHSQLASISFSIIFGSTIKISKAKKPITVKGVSFIPDDAREVHKSATFSKFYKGGPARIYQVLARYINQAQPAKQRMPISRQISAAIDAALPKLSRYLDEMIDRANKDGYLITTKLGRRRYFDTKVYGEAANAPIQGSNADAIKIAMINVNKYLSSNPQLIGARIVLNVHDELVVITPNGTETAVSESLQTIMATALTSVLYELQGGASVSIGDYWNK
jgi:DNA polymerase-1